MRKAIIFLCLCGIYQMIYAQSTPLFHSVDLSINNLSGQQLELYSKIVADDYFEEIYFIEFEDLGLVQSEGKILITIPNTQLCPSVKYYAKQVEYSSNSNYKWVGDVYSNCDTCFCSEGNFTLIKDTSGIYGHLTLDGEDYQIRDLGGEIRVLVKYNYASAEDNNCGMNEEAFSHKEQLQDPPHENQGNCKVKLLVLYDEDADNQDANIHQTINLAVAELHQILLNSAINPYYLTIEHVGTEPFSLASTDPNDAPSDLDAFATHATVTSLRNTYHADLVVLVSGTDYTGIGGISRMDDVNDALDFALIKEHGFSIVERGSQILGQFTFAHEVGHLFAAGHQTSTATIGYPAPDDRPSIPHGHSIKIKKGFWPFFDPKFRFTVMHTLLFGGDTRVPHYSNPNITFLGLPTGLAGTRNNALMIYNGACTVGSYLPDPDNVSALIEGESWACADQSECVSVQVWGLSSPITYQWSTSHDGINWQLQTSTAPNLCVIMPSNDGDRIFIKVVITSGTTVLTLYHDIETTTTGQNGIACAQRYGQNLYNPGFTFYPNPNNIGILYGEIGELNEGIDIELLDMNGKIVYTQRVEKDKTPTKEVQLDVSNLSLGVYLLHIRKYPAYHQKIIIHP